VRIFEYGGPMMHAKTHIVDGWFSRVGSANLNVSGLLANWEIDLMVEDPSFGAQMDEKFEEDLENAREIRLGRPSRARGRRPSGPSAQRSGVTRAWRAGVASPEASGATRGRHRLRSPGWGARRSGALPTALRWKPTSASSAPPSQRVSWASHCSLPATHAFSPGLRPLRAS
jgi:phosphatidylserine/phosphatidylglycerophosphate/cardiolipin synthase-like enzyme